MMIIVESPRQVHTFSFGEFDSASHLKEMVAKAEDVSIDSLLLSLDGLRLDDTSIVPSNEPIYARASYIGISGGKGGFGAQLRSLAKQRGKKRTVNFGACRDLSGRRLRHVNDEILLNKWKEAKDKGEIFEVEQDTASGISLWFLSAPAWADKVKTDKRKKFRNAKYKTDICINWKRARERGHVPVGASIHWGCSRGRRCEYAHGDSDLRGVAKDNAMEEAKNAESRKFHEEKDAYMRPMGAIKDEQEVTDLVLAGMRAAKRAKLTSSSSSLPSAASVPVPILPVSQASSTTIISTGGDDIEAGDRVEVFQVVSGQALVERSHSLPSPQFLSTPSTENKEEQHTAGYVVIGASPFCTVLLPQLTVCEGSWYLQLSLLSDGLMQLGWAADSFTCVEEGDGVGDDKYSWAYDGYRQQAWHAGQGVSYGPQTGAIWQAGDIVTMAISIFVLGDGGRQVEMSFLRNGESLGKAFSFLASADMLSFVPALSLEEGESLAVTSDSVYWLPHTDPAFLPLYHR